MERQTDRELDGHLDSRTARVQREEGGPVGGARVTVTAAAVQQRRALRDGDRDHTTERERERERKHSTKWPQSLCASVLVGGDGDVICYRMVRLDNNLTVRYA